MQSQIIIIFIIIISTLGSPLLQTANHHSPIFPAASSVYASVSRICYYRFTKIWLNIDFASRGQVADNTK